MKNGCPFVGKSILFPLNDVGIFSQKPVDCRYVGLFLGSHFYSIDQYGHPYSTTILSQLLLLCSNF